MTLSLECSDLKTRFKPTLIWNMFLVSSTFALASKISQSDRGMIPAVGSVCQSAEPDSLDSTESPSIVYVFPVPVWPYANTVQL